MDRPTGRAPYLTLVYSCKPSGGSGAGSNYPKKEPAAEEKRGAPATASSQTPCNAAKLAQMAWDIVDAHLKPAADHRLMESDARSNATWRAGCAIYLIRLLEARLARGRAGALAHEGDAREPISGLEEFLEKDLFGKSGDQLKLSYFMATRGLGAFDEYDDAAAECVEIAELRVSYLRIKGLIGLAPAVGENVEDRLHLLNAAAEAAIQEVPDELWRAQLFAAISERTLPLVRERLEEMPGMDAFEREIALFDLEDRVSRLVLDKKEASSLKAAIEKARSGE